MTDHIFSTPWLPSLLLCVFSSLPRQIADSPGHPASVASGTGAVYFPGHIGLPDKSGKLYKELLNVC